MIARNAILHNKAIPKDVGDDLDIIVLCQALHKLPSEVESMDPDWVWKMQIVTGLQQERFERDTKRGS